MHKQYKFNFRFKKPKTKYHPLFRGWFTELKVTYSVLCPENYSKSVQPFMRLFRKGYFKCIYKCTHRCDESFMIQRAHLLAVIRFTLNVKLKYIVG